MTRSFRAILLAAAAAGLSGCMVGPTYHRPSAPVSNRFKEAEGWTRGEPSAAAAPRGDWWTVLGDPLLDRLEGEVEVSNQNLAAAEAAYREARALVAEQRASLFPTVGLTGSAQRSSHGGGVVSTGGSGTTLATGGGGAHSSFQVGGQASWEPDLWGRIRRTVQGAEAQAQASEADLANARLSAQSELATDYVQLRADDEQIRLLDATVAGYRKALQIAQNRYNVGVAAQSDVLQAQTQLASAQAQATDLARQRAQMEHAIAVLTGRPPAELTIAPAPAWTLTVPAAPVAVPSTLLQRRPDIASAERLVAAANAQIGVQEAAYFPTLSLSADAGGASSSLGRVLNAGSTFWSLGADVAETLLDFGARHAKVKQAKAAYDQAVAQYRQTVLSAFQEVEDALAAERVLGEETPFRRTASQAADRAEQIALNQYRAGTADYTTVVVAQAAALSARTSLVSNESARIVAAVDLIAALGGGWPGLPGAPPPPAPSAP